MNSSIVPTTPRGSILRGGEIKGGLFAVLGTLTDNFDRALAEANVEDTLSRFPGCRLSGRALRLRSARPSSEALGSSLRQNGQGQGRRVRQSERRTLQGIRDGQVQGTVVPGTLYMYGVRSGQGAQGSERLVTGA